MLSLHNNLSVRSALQAATSSYEVCVWDSSVCPLNLAALILHVKAFMLGWQHLDSCIAHSAEKKKLHLKYNILK